MSSGYGSKHQILLPLILLCVIGMVYLIRLGSQANNMQEITIGIAQQPAFALMFIAEKKGYFRDEGLVINYRKYALGRDALQDVVEGEAVLATVFDIPFLRKLFEGEDVGIITTLHSSSTNHAVVAFKSSGINTPSDLRSKKIGVSMGTSTEYYLYLFLRSEGIDISEVTTINVEPKDLQSNLESGSVDAAVFFNPHLYRLMQSHSEAEFTMLYSNSYTESSLLTGKKDYIKQNPETIQKVLKALVKAENFADSNKEESIKLVNEWLDDYEVEGVAATWDVFTYSLTLNNVLVTNLRREALFLYDTGVYPRPLTNIRSAIVSEHLSAVKPEGVTIY